MGLSSNTDRANLKEYFNHAWIFLQHARRGNSASPPLLDLNFSDDQIHVRLDPLFRLMGLQLEHKEMKEVLTEMKEYVSAVTFPLQMSFSDFLTWWKSKGEARRDKLDLKQGTPRSGDVARQGRRLAMQQEALEMQAEPKTEPNLAAEGKPALEPEPEPEPEPAIATPQRLIGWSRPSSPHSHSIDDIVHPSTGEDD